MKKRILFVLSTFEVGGTVVSTKNLILLLDKDRYDITVLCMRGDGNMKTIFSDVKQIKTTNILSSLTLPSWRHRKRIIDKILVALVRVLCRNEYIRDYIFKKESRIIDNNYDTIVACQEGICTHFVSNSIIKNKVAWVRCDYSKYISGGVDQYEKKIYSKFNKIVCVSNLTSIRFMEVFPEYSNKIFAINNPQSEEYIISQSEKEEVDPKFIKKGITLVSIGRIDSIKRFTYIPKIASFLVSNDVDFKWYIIGDGAIVEKEMIYRNIKKEKVCDNVILLGMKTNPYYYIKNADLLVSLSISEACPRIINEAKILHTPVVCTNFDTAYEYIDNYTNGIIAPIDSIHTSILEIIQNKKLYKTISDNISDFKFDNEDIMHEIDKILIM